MLKYRCDREIFDASPAELPAILALNNSAVPAVNRLTMAELTRLHSQSVALLLVTDRNSLRPVNTSPTERPRIAAFVLLMQGPGADYHSVNYRWFSEKYERFIYVDRIVVADPFRNSGIGSLLYRTSIQMGMDRFPVLCAEVNTRPFNGGSLRFHRRHGFREVGQQDTEGGTKRVALFARQLRGE